MAGIDLRVHCYPSKEYQSLKTYFGAVMRRDHASVDIRLLALVPFQRRKLRLQRLELRAKFALTTARASPASLGTVTLATLFQRRRLAEGRTIMKSGHHFAHRNVARVELLK